MPLINVLNKTFPEHTFLVSKLFSVVFLQEINITFLFIDERPGDGYQRDPLVSQCTPDWSALRRLGSKVLSTNYRSV